MIWTRRLIALCWLALLLPATGARAAAYYVDADSRGGPASDANPGTRKLPWRTLARALSGGEPAPKSGDIVWVRGGAYRETLTLGRGGAVGRPLTIKASPGERPVLDGEGRRDSGIVLPRDGGADHVVLDGLAVANLAPGDKGVYAEGRTDVTLWNRSLRWQAGVPVTYDYRGRGPDVGAGEADRGQRAALEEIR